MSQNIDDLINRYAPDTENQGVDNLIEKYQTAPKKYGIGEAAQDLGVAALKGGISVGQGAAGLANILTGGLSGEALKAVGYDSQATNQVLNNLHTDQYKQGQQAVQEAGNIDGSEVDKGLNTLGALIANPMQAVGTAVESIPLMLPGLGLQSKLYKAGASMPAIIGAGAGMEGLQATGSIADQAQQAGRNWSDYALPALAGGAVTGAIAQASGMGLGDVAASLIARKGFSPLRGAVTEGLVEELPQSINEQVATNVAMGEPDIWKGTGAQGVQGAVAGGLMGAGMGSAGILTRAANQVQNQDSQDLRINLINPENSVNSVNPDSDNTVQSSGQKQQQTIEDLINRFGKPRQNQDSQDFRINQVNPENLVNSVNPASKKGLENLPPLLTREQYEALLRGQQQPVKSQASQESVKQSPELARLIAGLLQAPQQASQTNEPPLLGYQRKLLSPDSFTQKANEQSTDQAQNVKQATGLPSLSDLPDNIPARTGTANNANQSRAKSNQPVKATPKRGKVGGKFSSGEKVLTNTGRETTPFPKINKRTNPTLWLLENAAIEAESRGDSFNSRIFRSDFELAKKSKGKDAPQASKDSAEEYLFGDYIQPINKPILKPLQQPQPTQQAGESALAQKHEAYAQELAGNSLYQRNDTLKKARESVKEKYEQLKDKQVSFKPDLSIKDAKVGDDVFFPANSRVSSYGGVVKKINRTTMIIETNYMGNPMELKTKWGENGRITRGNEIILSSENDYKRLNEMMDKLGINVTSQPVQSQSQPKQSQSTPPAVEQSAQPAVNPVVKDNLTTEQPPLVGAGFNLNRDVEVNGELIKAKEFNKQGIVAKRNFIKKHGLREVQDSEKAKKLAEYQAQKEAERNKPKTLEQEYGLMDKYKDVSLADIEKEISYLKKNGERLSVQGMNQMNGMAKRSTRKAVAQNGAERFLSRAMDLEDYLIARKKQEQPKQSQSTPPTNPHTATTLKDALSKIFGQAWLNRLLSTGKFKIISRADAAQYSANNNAQAFYNPSDDTTYFIPENIDQSKDLKKLMLHELGVHALQLGKTTPEFEQILKQLNTLINRRIQSKELKAAIAAAKNANTPEHLMAEEVAGYLVEFHPELSLSQKIIAFFRNVLRKLGLLNGLNEQDIVFMAHSALRTAPESLSKNNPENQVNSVNPDSDIRYSLSQDVKDFFTGQPAQTQTLGDILSQLQTGKPKTKPKDAQYWQDFIVENLTDISRPFDRWVMNTLPPEIASRLIGAKDRAHGIKQAYEKEAVDKYGRSISDAIRAIAKETGMKFQTAKDMAGYWMSAVYAPEANAWLLEKDQKAIDALEQEKFDLMDDFNAIQNPSESSRAKLDAKLDALDKQIQEATDKRDKRKKAIERKEFVDLPQIRRDLVELRKDRTANATEIGRLEAILNENQGLAGGMNNFTANEIKTAIEKVIPKDLLKTTARPVYSLLKWKLENDIKDGKVSQKTVDGWNNSPNYVPLTGDPRTDDSMEDSFILGDLNVQKDYGIEGRTGSIAQNAIDASFEQVQKSARYHGWNEFKEEFHSLYNRLLSERMAEGLSQADAIKEIREEYGINRRVADTQIPPGDNDIVYRKDNKGFIYTVDNAAAMQALKGMNSENVPSILKPFGWFTSLQAKMVTVMMLGFAPTNTLRDVLEKSENLRTRKIQGLNLDMNQVANDALKNSARLLTRWKVLAGVLSENTPTGKHFTVDDADIDTQQFKDFLRLGGNSAYGDVLKNNPQELSKQLEKLGTNWDKAAQYIYLYNGAWESISGFSIYQSLIKHGVPKEQAAETSLNLMNFRKRGKLLSPLRTLYMFINPTMQGAHQLTRSLKTPRGRMRLMAYTAAAAMLYAFLRSGDDDDDGLYNKMDEQPNWSLYKNILIPLPNGEYFKIPVGFGMQQLALGMGVNLVRTAAGSMTVKEMLSEAAVISTRQLMPVAPAEYSIADNPLVWMAQTLTPQPFKPMMNVALDRTAFNTPLTNQRYERADMSKSLQGRKQTAQEYKDLAQWLASNGIVDMYPEQLRELIRGYFIGHAGDVIKLAIENPNAEKLGRAVVSPFFDRWISASSDEQIKERFYYRLRDKMNEAMNRRSLGEPLSPEERRLVTIGDKIKPLEGRARGKFAAATRAEKQGHDGKARNLRNQADKIRERYINYALTNLQK